jgi:hypothetical protein
MQMMQLYKRRFALALVVLLLALPACAGKVTGATPIATSALQADAIVIRVNELQATVIQACGPAPTCQPNSLDTALARDLVQTCLDLRTTLKAVPAGWQGTVRTAWTQARPRFAAVTNPAILAAVSAVDVILGGL